MWVGRLVRYFDLFRIDIEQQCHLLNGGSLVYGDNQSAIAVSHNGVKSDRTKHVDVKYHFITQTVEEGAVKLKWVPTTEQQADIFTKALHAPVFELLRKQLMTR